MQSTYRTRESNLQSLYHAQSQPGDSQTVSLRHGTSRSQYSGVSTVDSRWSHGYSTLNSRFSSSTIRSSIPLDTLKQYSSKTGLTSTQRQMPTVPKIPRVAATEKAFQLLKVALKERIALLSEVCQQLEQTTLVPPSHLQPFPSGESPQLDDVRSTLNDLLQRLQRRLVRVKTLEEDYQILLQLREECKAQVVAGTASSVSSWAVKRAVKSVYDDTLPLGPRKLPSLLQNPSEVDYTVLCQHLCLMEAQLSCFLGSLRLRVMGIEGLARLCPGDEYEVHLSYGTIIPRSGGTLRRLAATSSDSGNSYTQQKWIAKGHVLEDCRKQIWNGSAFTGNDVAFLKSPWSLVASMLQFQDDTTHSQPGRMLDIHSSGMLLYLTVNDLLKIKAFQTKRLGGVRQLGRDYFDVLQLMACQQGTLERSFHMLMNSLGTLRLRFSAIWMPLEETEEPVNLTKKSIENAFYNPFLTEWDDPTIFVAWNPSRNSTSGKCPSLSDVVLSPTSANMSPDVKPSLVRRQTSSSQPNLLLLQSASSSERPSLGAVSQVSKLDTTASSSERDLLTGKTESQSGRLRAQNLLRQILLAMESITPSQMEKLHGVTTALRLWQHFLEQLDTVLQQTPCQEPPLQDAQTLKTFFAFLDEEEYCDKARTKTATSDELQTPMAMIANHPQLLSSDLPDALVPLLTWHLQIIQNLAHSLCLTNHWTERQRYLTDRCMEASQLRTQNTLFPWSNDQVNGRDSRITAALVEQSHVLHHMYTHRTEFSQLINLATNDPPAMMRFLKHSFPTIPDIDVDPAPVKLWLMASDSSSTAMERHPDFQEIAGMISKVALLSLLVRFLEDTEWSHSLDHSVKISVSQAYVSELTYQTITESNHFSNHIAFTQLLLAKSPSFSHLRRPYLEDALHFLALEASLCEQLQSVDLKRVNCGLDQCAELMSSSNLPGEQLAMLPSSCWVHVSNLLLRVDLFQNDDSKEDAAAIQLKDIILEKAANMLQEAAYSPNQFLRRNLLGTLLNQLENSKTDRESIQARCSSVTVLAHLTHKYQSRHHSLWDQVSSALSMAPAVPAWLISLAVADESSTVRQHAKNTLYSCWPHAKDFLAPFEANQAATTEHRF